MEFKFVAKAAVRGESSRRLMNLPEMLNEADELALRKRIRTWLEEEHLDMAREKTMSSRIRYADSAEDVEALVSLSVDLRDEDFGTLIIQLRALGLIEKSERQRSVKDKGTYWTLTSYGDQHLTTLRAIRKDEAHRESLASRATDETTAIQGEEGAAKGEKVESRGLRPER
jgi:hypothetical protein